MIDIKKILADNGITGDVVNTIADTIKAEIPEFAELGIEPKFTMHFKRVKNTDEWDLDLEFKKKDGISLQEYFDAVE